MSQPASLPRPAAAPPPAAKYLKEGAKPSDVPEFLREFQEGVLERWLKSEEPPADNSGPVRVVTGRTFEAEVFGSGKDVFIEFYAPWWWAAAGAGWGWGGGCQVATSPCSVWLVGWCGGVSRGARQGPACSELLPQSLRACPPACRSGHCKKLAPIWEEVGKELAGDGGVVVAKLDATVNDVPSPKISVRGYPTLVFVTAKGDVIPYGCADGLAPGCGLAA
jgi:thiol-disulfide isomerase/thioredoxin